MKQQKVIHIPSREVPRLLQQGATLVDVRRPEEWKLTGVVEDSILLTFFDSAGGSQPEEWLRQIDARISVSEPLVLLCRTGHRTGLISDFLAQTTQRDIIYNVSDGILGWLATGLPIKKYPLTEND